MMSSERNGVVSDAAWCGGVGSGRVPPPAPGGQVNVNVISGEGFPCSGEYLRKPSCVHAFRWDGESCLPGWVVNPGAQAVRVELFDGRCVGIPGGAAFIPGCDAFVTRDDWVVITRLGEVHVMNELDFCALYVAVPPGFGEDADGATSGGKEGDGDVARNER